MKVNFGLKQSAVLDLANHLNRALANTYALYINTLNCHWNIEDARFIALHEMLQDQYEQLAENGDIIAERIRQMGEKVEASLVHFSHHTKIEAINPEASADEMLEKLAAAHEKIIKELRELSELGEKYKDYGLVDLLGGLLRDHEKTAWFLRSHL
ncbi:MAG: DNA starvation/stationary phase protection protein [Simkaniaceae bacterium]|nr:DNA starvation/stationary phase protection protein [Simkaniaceae bacterium]